jgi:uncharacterized protein DUF4399/uncharacterized protein DUF6130
MKFSRPLTVLVVMMSVSVGVPKATASSRAPASTPESAQDPAVKTPVKKIPAKQKPRVFFIQPKSGATVTSPVHLVFGVQNYEISPVPQGTVETARPGIGHHHVGVDTKCLPPGTAIPKASPWVHFGNGSNEIDMQLPPGPHTLVLEIGDDMHKTQPGLCATIKVVVK